MTARMAEVLKERGGEMAMPPQAPMAGPLRPRPQRFTKPGCQPLIAWIHLRPNKTPLNIGGDADDASIADAVAAAGLDVLQLHGAETPERAAALRARHGLPVWKALSVASREDVARTDRYRGAVDMILFDAKTPKGTLPGGMGLAFDWDLLAGWNAGGFPGGWGLAGGLDPLNVREAIARTGAPLVDLSSGVESAPGVKDPAKIAALCAAVRSA